MEKEHVEILLEDIQGKFELVLEGQESLRKKIEEVERRSDEKHDMTAFLIERLNQKIDQKFGVLDRKIDKKTDILAQKIVFQA